MKRTPLALAAMLFVVGCSDSSEPGPTPEPEPEPEGVTFAMTTALQPGNEVEHCQFVRGPAEGMLVNRDVMEFSEGSHHVLLYMTPYDEVPTEDLNGNAFDFVDGADEGVFDCSEGVQFFIDVQQLIGGSQNADGQSMVDFPPGVAMRVPPDAVLLINAHYINATPDPLEPQVDIRLETIEEEELEHEGSVMFWYNPFIKVAGQSEGYATTRCAIPEDVTVTNAQSHMHARGVGYEATVIEPGGDRTMIYENTKWENVPVERFQDGLAVEGGSTIEYRCDYDNPGTDDIFQGPRTTDEMCMFIASYYPSRADVDLCSYSQEEPYRTSFFGGEWVGQGTETCNTSITCFQTALTGGGSGEFFETLAAITECVNASDPEVAPELSEAIGCTIATFSTGGDPFSDCQAAFGACLAK